MAFQGATETTTVDGVVLNNLAFNILSGSGRAKTPVIRGQNIQIPGRDGVLYTPMKATDIGEWDLQMFVVGANQDGTLPTQIPVRQMFEHNRSTLHRLFHRRSGLHHVTQVQPDGSTREMYGEVIDSVDFTEMAGRSRGQINVAYRIPGAYWQDTAANTLVWHPGATLPATAYLTQMGPSEAPIMDSVISILGPITNPSITDVESGVSFTYTGALTSAQTLTIDCANFTAAVTPTVGSVLAACTHLGHPRFFTIWPRSGAAWTTNLLDSESAGVETTAATWQGSATSVGWFSSGNATVTRQTSQVLSGVGALQMLTVASGGAATFTYSQPVPVVPNQTYSFMAWARAAATPRPLTLFMQWITAAGASAGTGGNVTVADTTSGWTQVAGSNAAPSNAAYGSLCLDYSQAQATNEIHYLDQMGIFPGTTTAWLPGRSVPMLTLSGSGASSATTLTIQYRNKYIA